MLSSVRTPSLRKNIPARPMRPTRSSVRVPLLGKRRMFVRTSSDLVYETSASRNSSVRTDW
jgi:hypothetical protein